MFIDVFNGSFTITNENAWRERLHFFHIGPQSSRHILFIINDSYAGIDHHWSTNNDFLFIQYWLLATPWTAAHQASLSITNSQSLLKLMSIESVMPPNHLILYHPLLLLPSIFSSTRVFSKELVLCIRWPKYWSFSFSISLPMNIQDGFPLEWTISMLDLLAVQQTLIIITLLNLLSAFSFLSAPWYHQLNGHDFEQVPGVGDGQGSLACCSPWGCKESDMTEWLNWTLWDKSQLLSFFVTHVISAVIIYRDIIQPQTRNEMMST